MAQLLQPFDATGIDPSQGAGQLPVGKHPVIAYESSIEENSKKDGGYLQFMLKIIDGPAAGTTGAYRLNLYNASPKAVEIANRQMAALSHVTGVFKVMNSEQLHNIPFIVEVGLQKDPEAQAKGYTEIKRVFDRNGVEPGKQGQGGQPAQPQQPQGFGGQPAQQPQGFAQPQQQPQAPAAGGWGQPAQQQPQQPQQPAAGGAPAGWGGQPQAQAPAAAPAAGGWQQGGGAPAGGAAPWGGAR